MIYGFWTCKLGGTGIVEFSRCCEIESMELCKLTGGEKGGVQLFLRNTY